MKCIEKDCYWFGRCVSNEYHECFAAFDQVPPEPVLKTIITIRSTDTDGNAHTALCETRPHVILYLNQMPNPAGFLNILFNETGVLLTATRSTFLKAARNGTLFDQGGAR